MKQFWLTFFGSVFGVIAGVGLLIVFMIFLIGGLFVSALQSADMETRAVPFGQKAVLEIDLRLPRYDQPDASPFAFADPLSTIELAQALDQAAKDDQVAGLFIRANTFALAPAQAEELAAMFERFEQSGKFIIAHAQGFEGASITSYFAVGGVEELWLQDTSSFSAVGLSTQTLFLGGMFERFGAVPQFVQFHEYKNAADTYTQSDYTPAHREATLSWLESVFNSAIVQLAQRRGMEADALRTLLVSGPYPAEAALESDLVDRLGHVAKARQAAMERAGGNAHMLEVETYYRLPQNQAHSDAAVIALINGQGGIVTGAPEAGFGGAPMIGGDRMAEAIDMAARDVRVRAIVLRIDSPGGSSIASDQIWDAIMRARQAGKPVVASMGIAAASGGYYISAPADRIIANATTLTGSIGMLGGKIVIDGALERLGINLEPLSVGGDYALVNSPSSLWSEAQAAAYESLAEDVYTDFTNRVAEGRDLPLARVQDIARGRVWTGAQALELGLVDQLGGLHEAIEAARELAGIGQDEAITLRRYPAQTNPFEAFQALFGLSAQSMQTLIQLNALLQSPEIVSLLQTHQMTSQPGHHLYAPQ